MQYKLTKGPLLNNDGNLIEAGYYTNPIREYDRNQIRAHKMRIKEWDYYYIGNQSKGIAFTIADNSYMGLASVSILDFDEKTFITRSSMKFFTNGKLNFPVCYFKQIFIYHKLIKPASPIPLQGQTFG